VHVVEEDAAVRAALAAQLRAAGFEVRAYASAEDFLRTPPDTRPSCLLVDVRARAGGLSVRAALARREEPVATVFLKRGAAPRGGPAGEEQRARDTAQRRETLQQAVQRALDEDAARRAAVGPALALRDRYRSLTRREREVYALLVAGRASRQIAAVLGTADRTVRGYRASVLHKMHAASRVELADRASEMSAPPGRRARRTRRRRPR
jgi:FixJ family two-component response regulator